MIGFAISFLYDILPATIRPGLSGKRRNRELRGVTVLGGALEDLFPGRHLNITMVTGHILCSLQDKEYISRRY